MRSRALLYLLFGCFFIPHAGASKVTIAVASNFKAPMKHIVAAFKKDREDRIVTIYASSGKLFAQIKNGAPFDVFLSADQTKPHALEQLQFTVPQSRFTYATGALVLWTNTKQDAAISPATISYNRFNKLAIANPRLAPYGKAAKQFLIHSGVYDTIKMKLIQGENIAQTFQYVSTGNAELGLIALSQISLQTPTNHYWKIPQFMHDPIRQDAVLLKRADENPTALSFITFLKSPIAGKIMAHYGYQTAGDL